MNRRASVKLIVSVFLACAALCLWTAPFAFADEFDSDGVKIHYAIEGQGPPVILVHGLYSSAMMNWDLPGVTKALAAHYQVIGFDNRGHGQSGKPLAEDQYGVKMVEDIVRLMDHLHIAKAQVVGYSLGGMIVMKLLTTHPERITAAVLGGMGWLKENSPLQAFWELQGNSKGLVPSACLRGVAQLAVTEKDIMAVHVPVSIIVGERDPTRHLYVEPLRRVRPDWPEHLIPNASHVNCVIQPEFKTQLLACLSQN